MMFSTISVIGLGYIGLPTAAMLASHKQHVVGVDVNASVVRTVNQGNVHIVEPGLDMMVHTAVMRGYLRATTVVEPADVFIVSVPTPFKSDYEPDLSCIEAASKAVGAVLKKGDLVVLESTSPVGATEQMAAWLAEVRPDLTFPQVAGSESDIRIAHCPERVLPGHVLHELVHNDRVVGGMTPRCSQAAVSLYRLVVKGECIVTDVRTAELCKLTENTFRDVNIAFANELSIICDKLGIDVWELIRLANRHPRVNILQPGPGVGGHCIAVDPWFIVSQVPEESRLIRTAREVNDSKPHWVCAKVDLLIDELVQRTTKSRHKLRIACFGLAFKANIDDVRESPALAITLDIATRYPGQVMAVEPHLSSAPTALIEAGAELVDFSTAATADVLVFLVDHTAFNDESLLLNGYQRLLDTRGAMAASVRQE